MFGVFGCRGCLWFSCRTQAQHIYICSTNKRSSAVHTLEVSCLIMKGEANKRISFRTAFTINSPLWYPQGSHGSTWSSGHPAWAGVLEWPWWEDSTEGMGRGQLVWRKTECLRGLEVNFLSMVLDSVILLATKARDVSPQTVHACVKAEAQDSCLQCCGNKCLTYYSCKDVVDLLLCFPKLMFFLLVMSLVLCTSPVHVRVEMLPVRVIREAIYLFKCLGVVTSAATFGSF